MDECIYAIHNDKIHQLIANIKEIKSLEEIYRLIDIADRLQDTEIIWYIQEKKSRELPTLREEITRRRRITPCSPLNKLRRGLKTCNEDLIALAWDVIETSVDVRYLVGYTSQDYMQIIQENEELRQKAASLYSPTSRNS